MNDIVQNGGNRMFPILRSLATHFVITKTERIITYELGRKRPHGQKQNGLKTLLFPCDIVATLLSPNSF